MKQTLEEYIKSNSGILTVLGVFIALSAYCLQLQDKNPFYGGLLASLSLLISIVIIIELVKKSELLDDDEINLFIFKLLLVGILLSVMGFVLSEYGNVVKVVLYFITLYALLTIFIKLLLSIRQSNAVKAFENRCKKFSKHPKYIAEFLKIVVGIPFAIVIVMILVLFMEIAKFIVDYIFNFLSL